MRRFNKGDTITVIKEDKNKGKQGIIIDVSDLAHFPVTIFRVRLEDNSIKDYFFSEIIKG